jgi:hypothetical protein
VLCWDAAGPGSALALRQPPHDCTYLCSALTFHTDHIAVESGQPLRLRSLLLLLLLLLLLRLLLVLLLVLLLPPLEAALQVCCIVG